MIFVLPWRGRRPQPKVAITLRRDEHLSFKTHQPRQFSTTSPVSSPEGQSARALHSGGPVQGSSRRSVTATFRFYPHRVRTLVRTEFMHENNLDKSPPEILRGATRNQLFVVQRNRILSCHSVFKEFPKELIRSAGPRIADIRRRGSRVRRKNSRSTTGVTTRPSPRVASGTLGFTSNV